MTTLNHLKTKIIQVCHKSKEGHIPSAFSILDILWTLYDRVLNIQPDRIRDLDRDYFVLSKGHGSLGLYSVLAAKGFITWESFESFGQYDSILGGHPDVNKVPGVEASTGSLGHGFPYAVGLAYAQKLQNKASQVFVLIGDGEANEGSVWEAALIATQHRLNNLTVIVDFNHSTDRAVDLGHLDKKFEAFGFSTMSINGHHHDEIFSSCIGISDRPRAIIANTIKGFGCKTLEGNPAWHHRSPNEHEATHLIAELTQ